MTNHISYGASTRFELLVDGNPVAALSTPAEPTSPDIVPASMQSALIDEAIAQQQDELNQARANQAALTGTVAGIGGVAAGYALSEAIGGDHDTAVQVLYGVGAAVSGLIAYVGARASYHIVRLRDPEAVQRLDVITRLQSEKASIDGQQQVDQG